MTDLLLVCAGALVGAPARYLTDRAIQARHDTVMPWGTLTVNLSGSFVLGLLTGLSTTVSVTSEVTLLVGTGLCGTFTTYSSFAYETFRLGEEARLVQALGNVLLGAGGGLAAAAAGYAIGTLT